METVESGNTAIESLARYQRQRLLPEFADAGQHALLHSSALVVGLGGLGLPAASYLAGAGLGRLTLVDADVVEGHNLHRQVFFHEADVGKPKADVAASHLRALNGDIQVQAEPVHIGSANVARFVARADIVIDAADNFVTTYVLSDECQRQGKYLVSASLTGMEGYIGVFCGPRTRASAVAPGYRALFPEIPASAGDCNSAGVLGTAVGSLGVMQAQETIKLIVAPGQALVGKLLRVDFWNNRFSTIDFRGATEAGHEDEAGSGKKPEVRTLCSAELLADDRLVDVRSDQEARQDPVAGSLSIRATKHNIDFSVLPEHTARTVFFCVSGARASLLAAAYAEHFGHKEAWVWLRD